MGLLEVGQIKLAGRLAVQHGIVARVDVYEDGQRAHSPGAFAAPLRTVSPPRLARAAAQALDVERVELLFTGQELASRPARAAPLLAARLSPLHRKFHVALAHEHLAFDQLAASRRVAVDPRRGGARALGASRPRVRQVRLVRRVQAQIIARNLLGLRLLRRGDFFRFLRVGRMLRLLVRRLVREVQRPTKGFRFFVISSRGFLLRHEFADEILLSGFGDPRDGQLPPPR
mmetsp:Transcript_26562/g.90633  ORF Transcript_26562/g.90633 Transcript_26562/m.90633 type:complete len:230 (+) Transcript_26562:1087-1776(+)